MGHEWVFKIKRYVDGTIQRYEAQLVTKGFRQQLGFDFNETFKLVVKLAIIRLVLTLVVSLNWLVK